MPFKPVVCKVDVEDEDEVVAVHVRQPSGREMLDMASKFKKDQSALETARDIFRQFVVHEDGSAISKEEVSDMLEWRFSAMQKASLAVQKRIGLVKEEGSEAKKA